MKRLKKGLPWLVAGLLLLLALAGLFLQQNSYQASPQAQTYLQQANYQEEKDYLYFPSQTKTREASIIFYAGALVDEKAYALLAQGLASRGYSTYLIKSPLNLPILAQQKAEQLIKEKELDNYYLAGHSLGGVVAADNAQDLLQKQNSGLQGLILLASYPAQKTNLADSNLAVLSITAQHDALLNQDNYQKAKKYLPSKTDYQEIAAGNHSGFGLYGQQKKDGQATISAQEQGQEVISLIDHFIQKKKAD